MTTEKRIERAQHRKDAGAGRLRVVSYNVHACIGLDGKPDADRIASVLAACRPDVVAVQELDIGRSRSGGVDQPRHIAECLKMNYYFHPTLEDEGQYGIAVFSRLPLRLVKADMLPGPDGREPRGVIWAAVGVPGREVHLFGTHLGLDKAERNAQIQAILGPAWVSGVDSRAVVVLCGDFNAVPQSGIYRAVRRVLQDTARAAPSARPMKTYLGEKRIDYIFTDPSARVLQATVVFSELTRVASDHMPVVSDVLLERRLPRAQQSSEVLSR